MSMSRAQPSGRPGNASGTIIGATVNQRFQAAGYDMRVVPLAITTMDSFRYRSAGAAP